jgi:hypothetical protein
VSYELYILANAFLILMISIVRHKKSSRKKWHYKQHGKVSMENAMAQKTTTSGGQ